MTIRPFINKYYLDAEGKSPVSIVITYQKVRKLFPIGLKLSPAEYERIMNAKRRTDQEREIYDYINHAIAKAKDIAKDLPIFSFALFEERFFSNKKSSHSVEDAIEAYIEELKSQGRISTSQLYVTTLYSLNSFKPGLQFVDITPKFLHEYEAHMIKSGKSITTVGMYLRNLRHIFNRQNIDKSIYPFDKGKYEIPTGKNVKKAVGLDIIAALANYNPTSKTKEFARDMFIFSFQCNGMNIKDILLLKRSNVQGNFIVYTRSKTARTKREATPIMVSIKDESKEIIRKWGNKIDLRDPDPYLFSQLEKNFSPLEIRKRVMKVIKNINLGLKQISVELGLDFKLTTYYARHSFATILKRSGVNTEFISDALGHTSLKTTASYLASFEDDAIHKNTEILTGLKKSMVQG